MLCTILNIKRAPGKDTWHALNGVAKTLFPSVNLDEKSAFTKDLSAALSQVHEPDVLQAMAYLQRKFKYDVTSARREALASYRTDGRIRTRFKPRARQETEWTAVRAAWSEKAALARAEGRDCCIRYRATGHIKVLPLARMSM